MKKIQAFRPKKRPMAEINLVPFIDVMLVLLVVFMITTPLLTQGVHVDLPQTASQNLPSQTIEPLIITVNSKGEFFLNILSQPNQPITARVLSHWISQTISQNTNEKRPVWIRGDNEVNYGKIIEAMTILQQAGAKQVGLITQPMDSIHLSSIK